VRILDVHEFYAVVHWTMASPADFALSFGSVHWQKRF